MTLEEKKTQTKKTSKKLKIFKILRTLFLTFFIGFILLILFIRSPWGQNIIVNYATSFVSDKTHTVVDIENLYITIGGDIKLKGLYLEDAKGDTLIYSKSVEADLPIWPIIKGNGIGINALDWEGLRANIIRKDSISGYNFQFLIDAFASESTPQPEAKPASEPLSISISDIQLKDFDIIFNDDVLGIDSRFKIGELELDFDTFNLETMDFRTSNALISNSDINYIQSPVPPSVDTTSTTLPYLAFEDFKIKNVKAHYASQKEGMDLNTTITDFYVLDATIDLVKSSFTIEDIGLNNSEIVFNTTTKNTTKKPETATTATPIEWPELQVNIDKINFNNNFINYTVNAAKPVKNTFKADALFLNDFTFEADHVYLKDKTAGLDLVAFSFKEKSGLHLKKGNLKLEATDKHLNINNLNIALNNTKIQGYTHLDYPNISALANAPGASKLDLKLPVIQLDINDIYRFQPDLKTNPYVDSLSQKLITGQLQGKGYLSSIALQNTSFHWGKTTHISATGLIENATDPDHLKLNISPFKAATLKSDLLQFVNEKDLGVNLPDSITLSGTLKGTLKDISTEMQLKTSQGIANLSGSYNGENDLDFTSDLEIIDYKLNELLQNENLGELSVTLKANGSGSSINNINAKLDAIISSFSLNNYDIVNLPISGELIDGKGHIESTYRDENVNIDLQTEVVSDSIAPKIIADLNIIGIDLQALGMVQKDIRAGLKLHANFKGNTESFDLTSNIDQGAIVYENSTYLLGDFNANAHVNPDTTYVSITNKLINLELASNANPQTFSKALEDHIRGYFYTDSTQTKPEKPVHLKLRGKFSEAPVLNDVFLPNLKNIDTVNIDISFNQSQKLLNAKILAPLINYGGNKIDSLAFTIDTNPEKFVFDFGFKDIEAGPIFINETSISGNLVDHELGINKISFDGEEILMQIKSKITGQKEQLTFHILPDNLILNKVSWQTPSDNFITYSPNSLKFNNFSFTKNDESIIFSNGSNENNAIDEISIAFKNFDLKDFLAYLNPKKELAQGVLDGHFTVQNPFENRGYLADLTIDKFNILDTYLGTLTVAGDSKSSDQYNFELGTKNGDIDLDVKGDYSALEDNSNLNVDLVINEFKMKAIEGLSLGNISETSGAFSGDFKIEGSIKNPQYKGDLVFKDAQLKVTKLNSIFSLDNETINIDNSGIRLSDFTINDENKSTFVLNGLVGTQDLTNPTFNLTVNAEDFQVLNATKEENPMVYGLISFNAKGSIKGDLNIPIITVDAAVNPKTSVSYVMPAATVNLEERESVVIFVNREDPDAILTRNQEETSDITGFDIKANFTISKEAKLTLVLDESTGDNFETSGRGNFVFKMDTNGRINLSGVYTVASGHYEMSLYKLVKRKFELVPGSRVTWSGNPLDADLDVQALYNVKASASPLMASQISGSDPSVQNKYKQVLPFEVYLNIKGELMRPKISFNLDMPEDDRNAIGGQVYGYLQQLNQVEGELNRQVFSLLVMGQFFPEAGSDGSTGGFESIARDNLNDAISDQLNMFSDKLLGNTGLELDFGLNSFTDYQGDSPEQRTQLDVAAQKKLFNDRIIVRVGSEVDIEGSGSSGEDTPFLGDISLEYLITPSGKYRVRAFQENEFESVIDGQTIVSGIALIFTQEFNTFKELWKAMLNSKQEKADEKLRKEKAKADRKEAETKQKETTK